MIDHLRMTILCSTTTLTSCKLQSLLYFQTKIDIFHSSTFTRPQSLVLVSSTHRMRLVNLRIWF